MLGTCLGGQVFERPLGKRPRRAIMSTTLHALGVTSVNVVGAMLEFLAAQPASGWVDSPLRTNYAAPGPPPAQRGQLEARFGNGTSRPRRKSRARSLNVFPGGALDDRECRPSGKSGTARRGHQPDSGSRHKEGGPR